MKLDLLTQPSSLFALGRSLSGHCFESGQTGRLKGVRVDIDCLGAGDVLKQSHRCVLNILAENVLVALLLVDFERGVLEDTSVPVGALRGVLYEVLANACQVLLVQILLPVQFVLSVREATTLLFVAVVAGHAAEPKLAELGANLRFPLILLGCFGLLAALGGLGGHGLGLFELVAWRHVNLVVVGEARLVVS